MSRTPMRIERLIFRWVNACGWDDRWLLRLLLFGAMLSGPAALGASNISLSAARPAWWPQSIQGDVKTVKVSGSHGYATLSTGWLVVFDVAELMRTRLLGQCPLAGPGLGLELAGGYAYVASSSNGLEVIDVRDPSKPTRSGQFATTGLAWDLRVQGHTAYLAARGVGLMVLDISDPVHPVPLGTFPLTGELQHLQVVSNLVFVPATDRLEIIDATNPLQMRRAGKFVASVGQLVTDVRVVGRYAYLAGRGLGVLDLSDLAQVTQVADARRFYSSTTLQIIGHYAAVAEPDRLVTFDISDPRQPLEVGGIYVGYSAEALDAAGATVFLAVDRFGVKFIDLSEPATPVQVGGVGLGGKVHSVRASGGLAFLADTRAGLEILDLSAVPHLQRLGGYFTGAAINGLEVVGHHVLLSTLDDGFSILDVSVPQRPQLLGHAGDLSVVHGFGLAGAYAFVADSRGLQVLDLSVPTNLVQVANWPVEPAYGAVFGVSVAGHRAYVGVDLDPGVVQDVVDIRDPARPVFQGTLGTPEDGLFFASGASEVGDYILMLSSLADLQIYDGSGPGLPVLANRFQTRYRPYAVQVVAQRAYVSELADGSFLSGVEVLDVTDPVHLRSLGFLRTPDLVEPFVAEHRLYAAGWEGGLAIVPSLPGVSFTVQVEGAPGLPLMVEGTTEPGGGRGWSPLFTTLPAPMPLWFTDTNILAASKFYRARQTQ